jgi:uncharacterized protein (DUF1330 family)
MKSYLEASPEAGKLFYQMYHQNGRVTMLNLLRFRKVADYTNLEDLKPEKELSGEEAYRLYLEYTLPLLKEAGSRVLYYGKSRDFLIGPPDEKWDAVLLVEHASVEKFIAFSRNPAYLKTAGHRNAGLEDSRLLPSVEKNDWD